MARQIRMAFKRCGRPTLAAALGLLLAFEIPFPPSASAEEPDDFSQLVFTYPGNHGFIHETGCHMPSGWLARYRMDPPGYLVRGRVTGGETLSPATYEYVFRFALQAGSLGGLFSRASDVVRVEAWDRTRGERLLYRTFQISDFPFSGGRVIRKKLVFSTLGREDDRFEPRIYWSGLSSLFLEKVEVRRLEPVIPATLEAKAEILEQAMADLHLRRGFVLTRGTDGRLEDTGDAAIWTGLYAAAEAWRYQATRNPKALSAMENSLLALHRLHAWSPTPGTLVRYITPDGQVSKDRASKDTYTGFFFAVAQCLPVMHNRTLKRMLLRDVDAIAGHLLDHDLAFVPADGEPLRLSPAPTAGDLDDILNELARDPRARQDLVRLGQAVRWYFWLHGQRPWPELAPLETAVKQNDMTGVRRQLIPAMNGARRAIAQLQRNVERSAIAYHVFIPTDPAEALGLPEAPYGKLNRVLTRVLSNLDRSLGARPIRSISDLRIRPSQALHALHFIKVAASVLPHPNRYEAYYAANLRDHEALLQTVQDWNNVDEETLTALFGHTRAAVLRNASRHLSYLALYDLLSLEKDPATAAAYRSIFDEEYGQMQEDFNAMLHIMRGALDAGPDQVGVGLWSLDLYSLNRRGRGSAYWRAHHEALVRRYGEVGDQASEPVPMDQRQRDSFIWQRSARSMRGDDSRLIYPPLDYLFVYWLARAHGLL